jgi:UDP-N-acetylmuramate dehydrogenase
MNFQPNYSLSKLTTFRIGGEALWFVEIASKEELLEALDFAKSKSLPVLTIGGGSNLLVSDQGFAGLVIKITIKGIEVASENNQEVLLKVGSGEVWDHVVEFAVKNGYWGIENLSNIPGLTGGIPVQNVGAYGQEASQVVRHMEVVDLKTGEFKILINHDCDFSYRSSKFNTEWKGKYAILSVSFQLSKHPKPNLSYNDVHKYFESRPEPTQRQIRAAIIEIRKNKFPDLSEFGTAGSFFKNVLLTRAQYDATLRLLQQNFGEEAADKLVVVITKFLQLNDNVKIPAAFLIDICGLKGRKVGNARLWDRQPLVIINEGNAKASDVIELFQQVKLEVKEKTGLDLVQEPEFVGFENI